MIKNLLSGSDGFLGGHLVKHLLKKGEQVRTIPRSMLSSYLGLKEYINGYKPHYIYHLAAYGNHYSQKDLFTIYQVNVIKSLRVLQASREIDYRKLILFGTSSEYGSTFGDHREDSKLEPNTFYSASKVAQTYLGRVFSKVHDKSIITIRPSSVFGEGEASFRFIPTVIRSLKTGSKFKLDPTPTHDWIYIEDFIRGLIKARISEDKILNISTNSSYTNLQVVQTLEKISEKNANYDLIESMRTYDHDNWKINNDKLKNLRWTKYNYLYEGLKKTYNRS